MTTPSEGDAAMSFDTQSAVNNQGLKDLTIKAAFPDGTQSLQENDVAHLKNQVPGVNGANSPIDSKPQVADINLPTPTDSAVDSSNLNGAAASSAMDTDQPASSEPTAGPAVPEDPAVQQPMSESRDPVEPVSQAQAAEIQASKETTETIVSAPPAVPAAEHAQNASLEQTEHAAPAAVSDEMDTSDNPTAPALDLPHHPTVQSANGDAPAQPVEPEPAPVPAASAPIEVKAEAANESAPLPSLNTNSDADMKDVPPSPGKMSRSREDDSGVEEPEAKRMRPSSAAGSLPMAAQSPANAGSPASPAPGPAGEKDFQSPISEPQQKSIAIVIANTKRSGHAVAFSKPVDIVALNIPNYPQVVTEPMDLGTMNDKVKTRKYDNVQTFISDFGLIVSNCEKFNGTTHAVTQNAYKLRETFDKQMTRVPSAEWVEPPPPEKKKKMAAPKAPSRREPRTAAQPKTPVAASPTQTFSLNPDGMPLIRRDSAAVDGRPRREIHPPASKDLPYNARPKKKKYLPELRFCSLILHELDKAKFAPIAGPFKLPVDPVALNIPTYHKVIKKPMDLSTMRKKLDSGEYENAKEFDADMRLIFANCYKFNKPNDWVYQTGQKLEAEYQAEWDKKDDYLRRHAAEAGTRSADSSPEVESDEEEEEEEEEDEVPDDQISKIQAQMEAMSRELAALQKGKGKKKTPPALKKKGSKVKKEKTEVKKEKKSSKKKMAIPYVTYEQKQDISVRINTLPEARMMQALEIIKNNMPGLKGAHDDELELDIDELSNDVLYKLLQFVKKYAPRADDEAVQRRQSYAPTQPAKPKKNKPMGAKEQENRIEQLRRMQSGEMDGALEESSGDDEDESEDESEED